MESEIKYPEIYRIKLTAKILKDASEGKGLPPYVNKQDWMWYNLSSAIEDIAIGMERILEGQCSQKCV